MNARIKGFLKEAIIIIFFSAILVIVDRFFVPRSMSKWFRNGVSLLALFFGVFLVIRDWKRSHDLRKDPEIQKLRMLLDKSIKEEMDQKK
jgi:hypothetical protein